jgi:hypothetical protein
LSGKNLTPFKPGNGAAVTHGSYSKMRLAPRAAELANELREIVPAYAPSDEPTIQVLSIVLAQLETASIVLASATREQVERACRGQRETPSQRDSLSRLQADARGWANTARRYLSDLGMTPVSRSALGLNIVRGRAIELTVTRLAELADGKDEAA